MISKFKGRCSCCGVSISKGQPITWSKATGAMHVNCAQDGGQDAPDDGENPHTELAAELASDRRLARNGLTVVRFSSGAVMTQNSRGRCEDAPCCGCCS